jgi:uncharacterized protein YndB with AHSA1/START domain
MAQAEELGAFSRRDDHIDVRFERRYPRSVETVWSALTDPARLSDWMGVSQIEPRVGGRIEMMLDGPHPATGRVLVWDPPKVLEFTWSNTHAPDSVIRYELTPEGADTRLVFTHQRMPYANSALMLPGWHCFLARLGSALDTTVPPGAKSYRQMQAIYVDHYKLSGVTLDA